jgi:hypothetical protein
VFAAIRRVVQLAPGVVPGTAGETTYLIARAALNQVAAAFAVREGSMTDLHDPKRIDTIGWLFATFVVVVTAIAAIVTVSHIVGSAS